MSAPDAGLSRQAIKLYQSGHFREAEQLFRRLLEQDPENWQFALLLGLSRASQGDPDDGLKWIKRSVELGDGQPSTHYYYGRLLTDSGKPSAAREQFAQAIALDPNHVEARTGMALVSLMAGHYQRAVGELKTALRANPDHVPALAALARALAELGRHDEAYPYADKALQSEPGSPVSQAAMGQVFFGQGQLDFAEQCFRNALKQRPDSGELNARLAEVLKTRHGDQDALRHYIKALEQDYGGARVVIDASVCLERIGDPTQARQLIQKAAMRWPDDLSVSLRLAELAMLAGDFAAADELLATLDQQNPEVIMMQGRQAEATGNSDRARDLLEQVVDADSEGANRQARLLLARMRSSVDPKDIESAREPIAALLQRKPPVLDAMLVWTLICEKAGNFGEACKALEDVLENASISDQERRILHNRLGNCYEQTDEKALAWANWQKGAWRIAPHAPRIEAQRDSGVLNAWLNHDWSELETRSFDDGFPAPVIVAGWPGSGREILLAAMLAHPQVTILNREGENRRLDALGLPAKPGALQRVDKQIMQLGRKRFMRGVRRDHNNSDNNSDNNRDNDRDNNREQRDGKRPAVTLDPGWWEASAIPALAHYFPGATVVLPAAEPADLALQWRVDGYADVDGMVDEYRKELQLWHSMRDKLALNVIEFGRSELLDNAEGAVDRLCRALGLEPAPQAVERAERVLEIERFVPEGSGKRYEAAADGT